MWKGKRQKFEVAALSHLGAVFRFAVYLTKNEIDAEDLAQDAFVQALRKYELFRPGTDLKAWLFRITRNLYIDQLRRKKLSPQATDLADQIGDDKFHAPETWSSVQMMTKDDEESFYELFGDEVRKFLQELPDTFRLALLLCDVEGLSYDEIGVALDCPVGTVRSRISRARQHLREKLYNYARDLGYLRERKEE